MLQSLHGGRCRSPSAPDVLSARVPLTLALVAQCSVSSTKHLEPLVFGKETVLTMKTAREEAMTSERRVFGNVVRLFLQTNWDQKKKMG